MIFESLVSRRHLVRRYITHFPSFLDRFLCGTPLLHVTLYLTVAFLMIVLSYRAFRLHRINTEGLHRIVVYDIGTAKYRVQIIDQGILNSPI